MATILGTAFRHMGDTDHLCRSIFLIVPILLSLCVASIATFELTLLHTNDVHARFEEFNKHGTFCTPKEASQEGKCFGGVARRATKLKQIRAEKTNTLFIDGGDQFQGTLWFYYHKGKAAAYFMELLEYDAMVRMYITDCHWWSVPVEGTNLRGKFASKTCDEIIFWSANFRLSFL